MRRLLCLLTGHRPYRHGPWCLFVPERRLVNACTRCDAVFYVED